MDKQTLTIRAFAGSEVPAKARVNTSEGFGVGVESGEGTRFNFRSSKRKGFNMKQEQAIEQIDHALAELQKALASGNSDKLLQYLKMMRHFHHYSFGSLILILCQCPQATQVAGFRTWQNKFSRTVKKGEKGIRILAPMIGRRKEEEAESDDDRKLIIGFRIVHVFDVSQTEGDELPDIGKYEGDPRDNLAALEQLILQKGIKLIWESPGGGALGVSMGGVIMVDPNLDAPISFATLVHELAHELLHRCDRREQTDRSLRETEAEAVAFAVCESVGIKSNGHAENYIKLYQGDAEKLKQSLEYIRSAASEILEALLEMPKEEKTGSTVQ